MFALEVCNSPAGTNAQELRYIILLNVLQTLIRCEDCNSVSVRQEI